MALCLFDLGKHIGPFLWKLLKTLWLSEMRQGFNWTLTGPYRSLLTLCWAWDRQKLVSVRLLPLWEPQTSESPALLYVRPHPFLFISRYNQLLSKHLSILQFIHSRIHSFNKSLLRTYCVLGTCCYQGWNELDPVPVRGAHFSEKDVNQRIVMTECKIVPRTSVAKEKGGGCFESWDAGSGLWAWDLKVGEGVRSGWCAQSREHRAGEAVWGQDQRSLAASEESFWWERWQVRFGARRELSSCWGVPGWRF